MMRPLGTFKKRDYAKGTGLLRRIQDKEPRGILSKSVKGEANLLYGGNREVSSKGWLNGRVHVLPDGAEVGQWGGSMQKASEGEAWNAREKGIPILETQGEIKRVPTEEVSAKVPLTPGKKGGKKA